MRFSVDVGVQNRLALLLDCKGVRPETAGTVLVVVGSGGRATPNGGDIVIH